MFYVPTIPKWQGLHVLIVHIPIALLVVAPFLVLLAVVIPPYRRGIAVSTLVLLVIGTLGAWLATATGGAAAHAAFHNPAYHTQQIREAIHHHADLGETTRDVFTVLSILFFVMLMVPVIKPAWAKTKVVVPALLVFFVLCIPGMWLMADTGDAGGMLVHKYGLKADVFPKSASLTADKGNSSSKGEHHTDSDGDGD